jgi:hypothetical protein
LPDPDRREPHRADEQRADARRERKLAPVLALFAQPIGAARKSARPVGAVGELLDRRVVVELLGQDGERDVGQASASFRETITRRAALSRRRA